MISKNIIFFIGPCFDVNSQSIINSSTVSASEWSFRFVSRLAEDPRIKKIYLISMNLYGIKSENPRAKLSYRIHLKPPKFSNQKISVISVYPFSSRYLRFFFNIIASFVLIFLVCLRRAFGDKCVALSYNVYPQTFLPCALSKVLTLGRLRVTPILLDVDINAKMKPTINIFARVFSDSFIVISAWTYKALSPFKKVFLYVGNSERFY